MKGTFSSQVLIQRCRDIKYDVFLCSIDLEKAFDNAHHNKMIQTTELDDKDICIIVNLYWQQTAVIRLGHQMLDEIQIKRGDFNR